VVATSIADVENMTFSCWWMVGSESSQCQHCEVWPLSDREQAANLLPICC